MIDYEALDFKDVLQSVREELNPLYAKHEYLHEMLREFYNKKDFESDTVLYLSKKIDELNARLNTLRTVRDYLENLVRDVPFNVNRRVGIYMARFGLSEEQTKLLVDTYNKHQESMGSENRGKYLLAAARKVEWVDEEKCLHVHFEDTWWHYSVDGSWY